VRVATLRLLLGEQVAPMRTDVEGDASAYNRAVLEQRLSPTDPVVLAAPVAGSGVVVPMLHAVALRLLTGVAPADRAAWTRAFVARQPVRLYAGDARIDDEAEQARVILRETEKVREVRLPRLVQLGVFEPGVV
jgi:hypothetical protein